MKTAFAILSILMVSTPALAHEYGPERREARLENRIARERAFERFRFARLERERLRERLRFGCER